MKIEVWSDIACPFCYIGKRKLEEALAGFEHRDQVEVVFKSYQLDPDLVTAPEVNSVEHIANSKGWSLDQTRRIQSQVGDMAKEAGITMDFEHVVLANTYNAHRLIQFAKSKGQADAVVDRLYEAHFTLGKNIDSVEVLLGLAVESGLDRSEAAEVLCGTGFSEQVDRDKAESRYLEITGVPFFLFNERYAISGAQPVKVIRQALERTWAETSK